MKAVLLSSTYYLDEAVQQLSPNAERMLTRALAFCGNVESSGYISELNITMLGLPNPKKLARELVDAKILIPRPNGGWDFRTWNVWNSAGDALVARRKADRDRQARLRQEKKSRDASREMSRDASREMSRDVTPPNRTEQKRTTGYVESASPDSTASEPRSAPVTPAANRLVSEHIPAKHPAAVRTELRLQASALLKDGQSEELVGAALALWTTKSLHPKTLPSLVSELINSRNQPNRNTSEHAQAPPAARKVGIGLDLAREFANQPEQPALEA
ncbi:hypothetical protein [Mycobacteroides abscessus]|uniref:hypothetical protein n=1 Tax=Mycobacteroides abscessus TaxID=36809 RepID=UPI001F3E3773|nr:hypothetical protein [Mycobacteroides abscessus]